MIKIFLNHPVGCISDKFGWNIGLLIERSRVATPQGDNCCDVASKVLIKSWVVFWQKILYIFMLKYLRKGQYYQKNTKMKSGKKQFRTWSLCVQENSTFQGINLKIIKKCKLIGLLIICCFVFIIFERTRIFYTIFLKIKFHKKGKATVYSEKQAGRSLGFITKSRTNFFTSRLRPAP